MRKRKLTIFIGLAVILTALTANANDIDFDKLTEAVIQVESSGNPMAHNIRTKAVGLMQVTPVCLKEFNQVYKKDKLIIEHKNPTTGIVMSRDTYYMPIDYRELYDPDVNEFIGRWYLKRLYDWYGCKTIEQIASAYNGGITRLRESCKWDIDKMPRESRGYVVKVLKEYRK